MALNKQPKASDNGISAGLNFDVWSLVFGQLGSLKDLCNVCLTSRAWYTMAVPHLYKTVTLSIKHIEIRYDYNSLIRQRDEDLLVLARPLSSRLLDIRNERMRNAVHELDFGFFKGKNLSEMENKLVALVDSLPNLRRVKIRSQLSQEVFRKLARHSKQIPLHLLSSEDGRRVVKADLQNIATLTAQCSPRDESRGQNRDILGVQKLLFFCPNLTSFSLKVRRNYGGCVISIPLYKNLYTFQLSGDETFPPLEKLSLDGYLPDKGEWEYWHNDFQWSKLRSLTLGPQRSSDFLNIAAGYATSLQELTIQIYSEGGRNHDCAPLEEFLNTFTSLETLTVKGYYVPLRLVQHHSGLKHLCLHLFEPVYMDTPRPAFSVEQLQELDKSCPDLETLEIDLYRDGEWPEDFIKALATGFENLRYLTLHLELGLKNMETRNLKASDPIKPIEPILTEDSAKEVGQRFFEWRPLSKLNVLLLKTGEPLRRYPQWEPNHSKFERKNTYEIEVYRSGYSGGMPTVVTRPRCRLFQH
ncbi:hypothetical protein F5Y03DRAFT_168858 [Xylaria venustula]|nr:hypothetical protein F5Y03DRAFT_168858 [Xylaria venustula]